MSDIENRLMEIEIKNAHQENTIEELNKIVIEQQQSLAQLARHLELLQNKISHLQESSEKEASEPPPPHY